MSKSQLLLELNELRRKVMALEESKKYNNLSPAMRALKLAQEKFSQAFHCCPDILTVTTLNEGRYIEANEAFLKITGYTRSEVIGHTARELRLWANLEDRDLVVEQILVTGSIRNFEMQFRNKYNELLTTLLSIDKFEVDGEPFLICVVKDINDRKRMVEQLRLSEERFSKAFNSSPVTMTISTLEEGLLLDVNDSFCRTLGVSKNEVIGLTSAEIDFWVNPAQREEMKQSVLENRSVTEMEVQFRRQSGEVRWGQYSAERININGQICLLSLFTDLTERRQMEIEMSRLDRLNLVGEMAASIAHEIRNPMTTVRGYLQLLKDDLKYINEGVYFDLMIEELDRANAIISEFLSLAKGKSVELKPHSLNAILRNIYPLLQTNARLQDRGINLMLDEIPDIMIDEKEIRQLVFNLVNNGLESIAAGSAVMIRTYKQDNQVVLAIQDDGYGIDQKILENLGTPFFTTKAQGTGLGLTVCYGIAARHNAKIDFETGPDGTTFFVRFPIY
ncbi:Signal transduction histidine kinase, core [Syntrophomonas zehnderi OL-4]|uniref:histidine kinase n=2 Tax=Syntrophomonas TaxID=862 RepID=A0A0E3W328_9FIRM|nr:Signal transduction histidine kinase, core [Syntrophomonas zehnderi OL-4]